MIDRHATLLVWGSLGIVVAGCQLAAVVSHGRVPGLGSLVGRLTGHWVGRALVVLVWMWFGWHTFAR